MSEIIIMVGYPGAGKSTYINNNYNANDVNIVDGDTMKTSAKVITQIKIFTIGENKPIIIDATNLSLTRRSPIIKLATKLKIPVKCIWLSLDMKDCMDRAKQRHAEGGKDVPPVAFYTMKKTYIEPSEEEGFDEIIIIN